MDLLSKQCLLWLWLWSSADKIPILQICLRAFSLTGLFQFWMEKQKTQIWVPNFGLWLHYEKAWQSWTPHFWSLGLQLYSPCVKICWIVKTRLQLFSLHYWVSLLRYPPQLTKSACFCPVHKVLKRLLWQICQSACLSLLVIQNSKESIWSGLSATAIFPSLRQQNLPIMLLSFDFFSHVYIAHKLGMCMSAHEKGR